MNTHKPPVKIVGLVAGALMLAVALAVAGASETRAQAGAAGGAADAGYIDTHNHPPHSPTCTYDDRIKTVVLDAMDRLGIDKTLFMPQPRDPEHAPCEWVYLTEVSNRHPGRFAFLLGGETLQPMIMQVVRGAKTLNEVLPDFVDKAKHILRYGATGFGEMAAEHFSLHTGHSYESVPPDHPLFLLLADIAGAYHLPIDLHMEAIAEDITHNINLCTGQQRPPPNPASLRENIPAFERLLRHNRNARIVWAHAGWDNTGHRTPALTRRLLEDHSNLYIQLRPLPRPGPGACVLPNRLTDAEGRIRPGWLDLIRDFPDRFIIGLDSFYSSPIPGLSEEEEEEWRRQQLERLLRAGTGFVKQLYERLPDGLARKVAFHNAVRIYWLNQVLICHKPGTPDAETIRVNRNALDSHPAHGDHLGPCD